MTGHVERNRAVWDRLSVEYAEGGPSRLGRDRADVGHLGSSRAGGARPAGGRRTATSSSSAAGTAYWSAWLARRGARVVGLDNSSRQLATARALQLEHRLVFPLIHADAEHVPLADARFDLALSEYGASIWCDPYRWIPEAARVLRPGGELVFLKHGTPADAVRA